MAMIGQALKVFVVVAATLFALWAVMELGSFSPADGASGECPNSSLRLCYFILA